MQKPIKVLFLVPYPLHQAPSQRFRVELYFTELNKAGIQWNVQSFLDKKTWEKLYGKHSYFSKFWGVIKGFLRRWKVILFGLRRYHFVFIHREAAPLGPPVFEWIIAKIFRKKIIYDFDDAIWIPNTTSSNKIAGWLKWSRKVKYICCWSYKVVCGNEYLCDFAAQYNTCVICIPTSVDTENAHNTLKKHFQNGIVVGWTGSHSTEKYLQQLIPVLQALENGMDISFLAISDKKPELPLKNIMYCPWNENNEVSDLLKMDIGVMPLENDPWSEGKCGFKLIQYLSLGIPAVASPVGVNKKIIADGQHGFLCDHQNKWILAIKKLAGDAALRNNMGQAGRQFIIENYSLQKQAVKFISLFK